MGNSVGVVGHVLNHSWVCGGDVEVCPYVDCAGEG